MKEALANKREQYQQSIRRQKHESIVRERRYNLIALMEEQ